MASQIRIFRGSTPKTPQKKGGFCLRKRNNVLVTRFTDDELKRVKMLQQKSGLSGEAFRRRAILGAQIKEAPPNELPEFIRLLRRLNANAGQILMRINSCGFVDGLAIKKLIEDNRALEKKVLAVYTNK